MAGIAADLYGTIERTVEGLGDELVDVERLAAGLLRVTLDAPQGVRLEDCEKISRQLSHLFAVEEVDYDRLEVSSPGLDRPLKRARDFERWAPNKPEWKGKSGKQERCALPAGMPAPLNFSTGFPALFVYRRIIGKIRC